MRIPAKMEKFERMDPAPFFSARVILEEINVSGSVDFLCNTGATEVIFSKENADELGVPYERYPAIDICGIGGETKVREVDEKTDLIFKTIDGRPYKVSMNKVTVLEQEGIPSLIGRNFFRLLGIRLVYDIGFGAIYMEL